MKNFLIRFLLSAAAVWVTAYFLDGVTVEPWWYAAVVAVVMAVINTVVRPVVKLMSLPINVVTLGLFTLVINALMVLLADWLMGPHFECAGFWWALGYSIVVSIATWLLMLLAPDKD